MDRYHPDYAALGREERVRRLAVQAAAAREAWRQLCDSMPVWPTGDEPRHIILNESDCTPCPRCGEPIVHACGKYGWGNYTTRRHGPAHRRLTTLTRRHVCATTQGETH